MAQEQNMPIAWDKDNIQWQRLYSHVYYTLGVEVELTEGDVVKVRQVAFKKLRIYNQKELHKIGRDLYPDKRYKIHPTTFSLQVEDITPEWIQEQMVRYGVKPKDLVQQLALGKATISVVINGIREVAPSTKALFYYYFQTKRLGYELAQEVTAEEFAEALALVKARKAQEVANDAQI